MPDFLYLSYFCVTWPCTWSVPCC